MNPFQGPYGGPLAAIAIVLVAVLSSPAQMEPTQHFIKPIDVQSGAHDNPSAFEKMVWQRPVQIERAVWLKLHFRSVNLPGASRLEITSFKDRCVQWFDQRLLEDWFPHSAYFNGDAVLVRLFAGPFTRGVSVELDSVELGLPPRGHPPTKSGSRLGT